ncbi:MAG TPA: hypothetical protein V6C65_34210 [Allocoleopsis sp.]
MTNKNTYSIADIALYAYTHVATDGGFDLMSFVAIQAWMQKVQQQPGYVAIEAQSFESCLKKDLVGRRHPCPIAY